MVEILVKSIKVLLYMYCDVVQICINMFKNFIQEEESSTRLNMFMIKKFQKDLKNFHANKIIKRYFFIVKIKDPKKKAEFIEIGCNSKEVNHPNVFGETTDGKIIHTNITHSKYINGKKTILVDEDSGSYMNSDCKVLNSIDYPIMNKTFGDNTDVSDKLVKNVVKSVKEITGKEFKNKNLESIESVGKEPVDKL